MCPQAKVFLCGKNNKQSAQREGRGSGGGGRALLCCCCDTATKSTLRVGVCASVCACVCIPVCATA